MTCLPSVILYLRKSCGLAQIHLECCQHCQVASRFMTSFCHQLCPKHNSFLLNLTHYFSCQINVAHTKPTPLGCLQQLHTSFHVSSFWGANSWSPSNVRLPILAIEQPTGTPTLRIGWRDYILQWHNLPGNTYPPFLFIRVCIQIQFTIYHLAKSSNCVPIQLRHWTLSRRWHTKSFIHKWFMKPPVDITYAKLIGHGSYWKQPLWLTIPVLGSFRTSTTTSCRMCPTRWLT
jgi:hypothetical protein